MASLQIRGSIRGVYKKVNSEKHFQSFILAAVWESRLLGNTSCSRVCGDTIPIQGTGAAPTHRNTANGDAGFFSRGRPTFSFALLGELLKKEEDQDNPKGSGWLTEKDNYHLEIESVMKCVRKGQLAMGISRGQF